MSWDISIQRFSRLYTSIAQIPDDESCVALGSQAEVRAAISQAFPDTHWSDPAWGTHDTTEGSIEFNLGESEPNDGFMLHVRASEQVVRSIIALCQRNGWQAIDCSSGEFLEQSKTPTAGLNAWSAFRDKALGEA